MKKILLSLLLVFALAFSTTAVCFASVGGGEEIVQPYATSSINIGVDRTSGTKAISSINVNFATNVDSYTITVYLQKLSNNAWVNDTNNEDYVTRVTGSNSYGRLFDKNFDKLTYGTSYRLKVVSKTVYAGTTYTKSAYSGVF